MSYHSEVGHDKKKDFSLSSKIHMIFLITLLEDVTAQIQKLRFL